MSTGDGQKLSNPKDQAANGRIPMHMVPDTLVLYAAMAFAEGDSKYVAYNFRIAGVRASVYISALRRHLMRYVNGEWADKKTKVPHLASVAACVAILIDGHVTQTIVDDRPPAVDLSDEIERAEEIIAHVYALNKDKRPAGVSYTIASPATPTLESALATQAGTAATEGAGRGWIVWTGGDCPVCPAQTKVDVWLRKGKAHSGPASRFFWGCNGAPSDIVCYRVADSEGERK